MRSSLNDHQREGIAKLFDLPEESLQKLFDNIEWQLSRSHLPKAGSREMRVKAEVKALSDLKKNISALQKGVVRLSSESRRVLDLEIVEPLWKLTGSERSDLYDEQAKHGDYIQDAIRSIMNAVTTAERRLSLPVALNSKSLNKEAGLHDHFIVNMETTLNYLPQGTPPLSRSKFVNYLTIIADQDNQDSGELLDRAYSRLQNKKIQNNLAISVKSKIAPKQGQTSEKE